MGSGWFSTRYGDAAAEMADVGSTLPLDHGPEPASVLLSIRAEFPRSGVSRISQSGDFDLVVSWDANAHDLRWHADGQGAGLIENQEEDGFLQGVDLPFDSTGI